MKYSLYIFSFLLFYGCESINRIEPIIVTQTVPHDSDDPAIWIHPEDPSQSLILGTDKDELDGGVYAFDLEGNKLDSLSVRGVQYPNNIDVEYGFMWGDSLIDIAVSSEREAGKIRVYSLPDLKLIDQGGFEVFEGEKASYRRPMGIALYKNPALDRIEVFVSRKEGPAEGYIGHYFLSSDSTGNLSLTKIQNMGAFVNDGRGEIEALVVDDKKGRLYYSDESCCIRVYNIKEGDYSVIGTFGQTDFREDREGIALLHNTKGPDKLIISDQQEHAFNIYSLGQDGLPMGAPKRVYLSTRETDGCDLTPLALPGFSNGLFVAMSDDATFHYYDLEEVLEGNKERVEE